MIFQTLTAASIRAQRRDYKSLFIASFGLCVSDNAQMSRCDTSEQRRVDLIMLMLSSRVCAKFRVLAHISDEISIDSS